MSNEQESSRTEEARRFKFVILETFLKKLVKMVDKEEFEKPYANSADLEDNSRVHSWRLLRHSSLRYSML
jgi:hypothetical protein